MNYVAIAAWGCMTGAAVLAVAAEQNWSSLKGALVGAGLCLAAVGAALTHPMGIPPTTPQTKLPDQHA